MSNLSDILINHAAITPKQICFWNCITFNINIWSKNEIRVIVLGSECIMLQYILKMLTRSFIYCH